MSSKMQNTSIQILFHHQQKDHLNNLVYVWAALLDLSLSI